MAVCKYCNNDMLVAEGCVKIPVDLKDGRKLDPIPYGGESEAYFSGKNPPNCHDCNAEIGYYHHTGCDWEQCPNCGEQLLSCDCWGETPETENQA
jgi:hypothetical protein